MQSRKLSPEEWEHSKGNHEKLPSKKRVEDLHDRLKESYDSNYDGKVFFYFFFAFWNGEKNLFFVFLFFCLFFQVR